MSKNAYFVETKNYRIGKNFVKSTNFLKKLQDAWLILRNIFLVGVFFTFPYCAGIITDLKEYTNR